MGIATAISLYTSRIVLHELGIDGYGLYILVAGIVTFWSFLNSSMSVASSRFLSVAEGKDDADYIRKTFTSVFISHLLIALTILVLAETGGLWFINNKLKIDNENIFTANVIYQFSILSVIANVIQVPFTSLCIAKEKMRIFASYEIVNSGLKLLSVFIIIYASFNKVELYSILIFLNALIMFIMYLRYGIKNFSSNVKLSSPDIGQIKEVFSFTAWDLFSNGAVSLRLQGTAVLYKLFIGLVANAAMGICMQIQGVTTTFANNIATAIRPQLMKAYANNEFSYIEQLAISGTKLMGLLMVMVLVPLIIECEYILKLWLGNVPEFTCGFIQITLISVYYWTFSTLLHSIIHATGHVKNYSLISGVIVLSEVAAIYLIFYISDNPYTPQILRVIVLIILGFIMLSNIHNNIETFNVNRYLKEVYLKGTICIVLSLFTTFIFSNLMNQGWCRLLATTAFSSVVSLFFVWTISFSNIERLKVKELIANKFKWTGII
ncbi:MAG: hypothetical protein NC453_23770 [Muribaculum sp.]|nr:hypothetical protein [Muribaculum sp.]